MVDKLVGYVLQQDSKLATDPNNIFIAMLEKEPTLETIAKQLRKALGKVS